VILAALALAAALDSAAPAIATPTPSEPAGAVRVLRADGAPVSLELVRSAATPVAASAQKTASPMPNLYKVPERCRNLAYQVVDSQGRPVATRLADLPSAGGLQLLVDRKIGGCRVITVKYGTVAPDQPNPPANRYQVRPLGEPSNRR
jgi:hypothetical protein